MLILECHEALAEVSINNVVNLRWIKDHATSKGRCGANEILNKCASPCAVEPTCHDRHPIISESCKEKCVIKCQCKPGYVQRETGGPCIENKKCQCGCNETNGCRPCCGQATCQNKNPSCDWVCPSHCVDECVCNEGYIRNSTNNGQCILEENC
ncbi:unnamed protein product [Psylliodes chrysocephalus]|uniref:TIL domain-containing protein n=1 Tax=Psylliodes chrysocephalus TaxID=3402493 RepID=A0A9P0D1E1_9CUCU|nr:unnamed protein product [Psylliodes chrysocephala]